MEKMILVPYDRYQKLTANQTPIAEDNQSSSSVVKKRGYKTPNQTKLGPPGAKSAQKQLIFVVGIQSN
jgi:hypothetical protein